MQDKETMELIEKIENAPKEVKQMINGILIGVDIASVNTLSSGSKDDSVHD